MKVYADYEEALVKLISLEGLPTPERQFHVYPLEHISEKKKRQLQRRIDELLGN